MTSPVPTMLYRHFVTGAFAPRGGWLSGATYAQVLDHVVVTCVDCMLLNNGQMLLGRRSREPQPDWWLVGGRMHPGESFEQTAARKCREELGLTLAPSRFRYVVTVSEVWARRAVPPAAHGCHMVAVKMWAKITAAERVSITPNDEYRELGWRSLRAIATDRRLHPALRQCARDLKKRPAAARLA